jgi:hypothetical protein
MLHIITPIFRTQNIQRIYDTIPKKANIVWHISFVKSRENEINIENQTEYPIIIKYPIECDDTDTISKRNAPFSNIKNGYFCMLDDDTVFLNEMYILYYEMIRDNFIGMAVGHQLTKNGKTRLGATAPASARIDTGNAIAHHSCLKNCKWAANPQNERLPKDYVFWDSVYNFFNRKCRLVNKNISIYNKLR